MPVIMKVYYGIAVALFLICGLIVVVLEFKTKGWDMFKPPPEVQAKMIAAQHDNQEMVVVDGKEFPNLRTILALESSVDGHLMSLTPCNPAQQKLKQGDKTKFIFTAISQDSDDPKSINWLCYMK